MAAWGAFSPLYRVGGDAMIADLIPSTERPGAYALLRMSNNLGVAIGPAIGGFVAAVSYAWAFGGASLSQGVFALLVFVGVAETVQLYGDRPIGREGLAGYGLVLRDRPFLGFAGAYALAGMCYSLIWVLLPVYAKDNYGVPESLYGFIPATNAAMVVLLQYVVTRVSSRRRALPVLAVGALFYALGIGSVSLGRGFPFFLGSMVIATIGELIMIPTATAYTANKAPADMRGRYMATYSLTYSLAQGIGPVIAGYLNDHVGPVWIWYAGLAFGMASASGFGLMARASRSRASATPPPTLQTA
jgi:MFS family permease